MSTATGNTAENAGRKTTTAAGWKRAALHTICLPSSTIVTIKIPDMSALIETGVVPQNLMDAALGLAMDPRKKPTPELMGQQRELTDLVVKKMVVDPTVADDDLAEIPYEDKEMLMQIAMRQIDLDAEGSHIGGLDTSEKFRRFRRLGEFDPTLADL